MKLVLPNWDDYYPDCEPIGHHLRAKFPDRWARFHSLPESKRYPENEAECRELLDRHNRVLGALAQPGQPVVLLTTGYSESAATIRTYPQLPALDPQAVPWRSIALHQADEGFTEPTYWHLFASRRVWRPGEFDSIVRLVADDVVANVMVAAEDCRWVLYPYDGGMDVITESQTARDQLRDAFRAWLSARPDGL